ncbi:phytanoyl-dioxygenase family protein, partial [Teratosphaeria destructans]
MPRAPPQPFSAAVAAAATAASLAGLLVTLYYLDIPTLFNQRLKSRQIESRLYSTDDSAKPSLAAFRLLTQQPTLKQTYPLAHSIQSRIPIYDCTAFDLDDDPSIDRLQNEWHHILLHGP